MPPQSLPRISNFKLRSTPHRSGYDNSGCTFVITSPRATNPSVRFVIGSRRKFCRRRPPPELAGIWIFEHFSPEKCSSPHSKLHSSLGYAFPAFSRFSDYRFAFFAVHFDNSVHSSLSFAFHLHNWLLGYIICTWIVSLGFGHPICKLLVLWFSENTWIIANLVRVSEVEGNFMGYTGKQPLHQP